MANLPAQFAELERFIDWALPSETERYDKRLAATMDEFQDVYDTAFPLLANSTDYLKSVSLDDISDEATTLLRILEYLVTVAFPFQVWPQQRVPARPDGRQVGTRG